MACKFFHCVNTITVGTTVLLGFTNPVTLADTGRICFKVADAVPSAGDTLPVYMTINGANVPVWNKYGNPMTGADLKQCRLYKAFYGASTPHVIVQNEPTIGGCV